ncbi:MAG: glutamate racemase [Lachnospiraceae bacterium]
MDKNAPIGVFDSGVGGLTVAREIMRQIPDERIVYFGDTARVPYGSKSKDTIIKYSRQIVRFLMTQNVKAIVVACNTASAFALEAISGEIDIPMIGVVKPGARVAAEATQNGKIGVIGTEGTIKSGLYTTFLKQINSNIQVVGKACPLFVPLVEEGLLHDNVTDEIASRYLESLKEEKIDTLILGCTHYPLIRSTIRKVIGDGVNLVNPAYETAVQLRRILEWEDLAREEHSEDLSSQYKFYVSDSPDRFQEFANSNLPFQINETTQINIEEY